MSVRVDMGRDEACTVKCMYGGGTGGCGQRQAGLGGPACSEINDGRRST